MAIDSVSISPILGTNSGTYTSTVVPSGLTGVTYQWQISLPTQQFFSDLDTFTNSTLDLSSVGGIPEGTLFRLKATHQDESTISSNYSLVNFGSQGGPTPSDPRDVAMSSPQAGQIFISWTLPEIIPFGILYYRYRLVAPSTGYDTGWVIEYDTNVTLSNLAATKYYVFVHAVGYTPWGVNYNGMADYAEFTLTQEAIYSESKIIGEPLVINGKKTLIFPTNEVDIGYGTYSAKFTLEDANDTVCAGIFINLGSSLTSAANAYFVEIVKYKTSNNIETLDGLQKYGAIVYQKDALGEGSVDNILGFADITPIAEQIIKQTPAIFQTSSTATKDIIFHLKVVRYEEDESLGSVDFGTKEVLRVYLNNREIINWLRVNPDANLTPGTPTFETVPRKRIITTGNPPKNIHVGTKRIVLPDDVVLGTKFGFYASRWSKYSLTTAVGKNEQNIQTYNFKFSSSTNQAVKLLEIYATQTPILDRRYPYYHKTQSFLTNLASGKKEIEKTYMMQTRPEVSGLNEYDVQYTSPAATNVDVLPVEYLMYYFPSEELADQKYLQKHIVYEDSASYSSPVNTGFRAKMYVANNSNSSVFLSREPDSLITVDVDLNLWTHNIVTSADEQVVEKVLNPSNAVDVVQINSEWIQSRYAAEKIATIVGGAVDGFSREVSLKIFGNPLLQPGDRILLTYPLSGIQNQLYLVRSVENQYDGGLSTTIKLNRIFADVTLVPEPPPPPPPPPPPDGPLPSITATWDGSYSLDRWYNIALTGSIPSGYTFIEIEYEVSQTNSSSGFVYGGTIPASSTEFIGSTNDDNYGRFRAVFTKNSQTYYSDWSDWI